MLADGTHDRQVAGVPAAPQRLDSGLEVLDEVPCGEAADVLERLGKEPLLSLRMRLGEGVWETAGPLMFQRNLLGRGAAAAVLMLLILLAVLLPYAAWRYLQRRRAAHA